LFDFFEFKARLYRNRLIDSNIHYHVDFYVLRATAGWKDKGITLNTQWFKETGFNTVAWISRLDSTRQRRFNDRTWLRNMTRNGAPTYDNDWWLPLGPTCRQGVIDRDLGGRSFAR